MANDFEFFTNLVYPGAYEFELTGEEFQDNTAVEFCKLFTKRCKQIGAECYYPPSEDAPHPLDIFDDMFFSSKFILAIFTQNLSVNTRISFEHFYERIIISLQEHRSPVRCFPVLIGRCAVPRITRYQVPACFELANWRKQKKEWKFLLNGMGYQVDEMFLREWSGEPPNSPQSGPSRIITPRQYRSRPTQQQTYPAQVEVPMYVEEDCYDLSNGGVVIFLNYMFVGKKDYRPGAEVDVKNYQQLFKDTWGYTFDHKEDLTLTATKNYFGETSLKQRFSGKRFSCVVVIVSSHGKLNEDRYVFQTPTDAYDQYEEYEVEDFIKHAREGLYKAVTDRGCPTVFLFSTCHGKVDLQRMETDSTQPSQKFRKLQLDETSELSSDAAMGKPQTADLFQGFAQTKGSPALRGDQSGTWYLSALFEILRRNEAVDLSKAHRMVQRQVSERQDNNFVQQPAQYNTLHKDLYLSRVKRTASFPLAGRQSTRYEYFTNIIHPGAYSMPNEYLEKDDLALDFSTIFKYRSNQLDRNQRKITCYNPENDKKSSDDYRTFQNIHNSSEWTLVVLTENLPSNEEHDMERFYQRDVVTSLKSAVGKSPEKFIAVLIGECEIPEFMKQVKQIRFKNTKWNTDIDQWRTLFSAMQVNLDLNIEIRWRSENIEEGYHIRRRDADSTSIKQIEDLTPARYPFDSTGAVIFLNYKFLEPFCANQRRKGSEIDVRKLKELFQKEWNYYFDDHEGLSKSKIREYFKPENLSKRFGNKWAFSRVIVVVSSHGKLNEENKYVFQVPNRDRKIIEEYAVEDFIDDVKEALHNTLIEPGRPKVFLFATCHGEEKLECDSGSVPVTVEQFSTNPLPVPKTSDTFIGYAQTKGSLSWRDPAIGTLYLNSLHDTLRRTKEDICTVHTIAQNCVCDKAGTKNAQQPAFYSTLRKKLFLSPP